LAGPSAKAAVPGLTAQLRGAGVSAAAAHHQARDFRACFHARATEKDPSAVPAICRRLESASAAERAATDAATYRAGAADFSRAIQDTLWWVAGAYAFSIIPILLMPRRSAAHP